MIVWLHYRAFNNLSLLTDAFDFVIVNEDLHREFDEFKKCDMLMNFSCLEIVELLQHYLRSKPSLTSLIVEMYGKKYLRLNTNEMDDLCYWVQYLREQHKVKGNEIFRRPVIEGI